jgi:hypothetical protein
MGPALAHPRDAIGLSSGFVLIFLEPHRERFVYFAKSSTGVSAVRGTVAWGDVALVAATAGVNPHRSKPTAACHRALGRRALQVRLRVPIRRPQTFPPSSVLVRKKVRIDTITALVSWHAIPTVIHDRIVEIIAADPSARARATDRWARRHPCRATCCRLLPRATFDSTSRVFCFWLKAYKPQTVLRRLRSRPG